MSDLSERILSSAQDLFFKNGYYSTTTRAIAKEAKTSESGIFRMYRNKYELLMSVYNESWRKVNARVDSELVNVESPIEAILTIANVVFSMYDEDRLTISFIIMNTGNTDTLILEKKSESIISEENIRYITRLQKICRECFTDEQLDTLLIPESLCEGIMALIEGVLLGWYLADNSKDYPYKISKKEATNLIRSLLNSLEV